MIQNLLIIESLQQIWQLIKQQELTLLRIILKRIQDLKHIQLSKKLIDQLKTQLLQEANFGELQNRNSKKLKIKDQLELILKEMKHQVMKIHYLDLGNICNITIPQLLISNIICTIIHKNSDKLLKDLLIIKKDYPIAQVQENIYHKI